MNGFAIASFVLSFCGGILLSVIFGIIALVQTKRTGQSGRGFAIGGLAISAMWTLVFAGAVVVGLLADSERDSDGQISEPGIVDVFDLRVGDCLESLTENEELSHVRAVPCSQPHLGEVYALFNLPGSTFPGVDEIVEIATEECWTRLVAYSQAAADDPTIEVYYMHPTSQSWRRGDREIACVAVSGSPRTGSIQD